jgi:hypothetical protein
MKRSLFRSPTALVATGLTLVVLTAGGWLGAAAASSGGKAAVHACYSKHSRVLYFNGKHKSCAHGKVAVKLSVAGPRGPKGSVGPRGLPGTPGTSGTSFKRIVTVSPTGTDTDNGATLLAAITGLGTASPAPAADSPYLVFVEPGTYDIGGSTVSLPANVSLEGSGAAATLITGTGDNVLTLGANSEVSQLTVHDVGAGSDGYTAAVYVPDATGTELIQHLSITDSGGNHATTALDVDDAHVLATDVQASSTVDGIELGANTLHPGGTLTLSDSSIVGTSEAIGIYEPESVAIVASEVAGGLNNVGGGSAHCVADYTAAYAAVAAGC